MEKLYSNHRGNKYLKILNTKKGNDVLLEQVLGDSYQKQLSGKNLMSIRSNLFTNGSQTVNGITVTHDENGLLTIRGTATANAYIDVTTFTPTAGESYKFVKVYPETMATSGGGGSIYIYNVDSSASWVSASGTVITPTTAAPIRGRIYIPSGVTVTAGIIGMMIVKSTETDLTYEEFCGGTASPNPSYPQEIESVDAVTIKAQNKNLYNAEKVKNGYYLNTSTKFTSTGSEAVWQAIVVEVEPNSQLTISGFDDAYGAYSAYLNSNDINDVKKIAWSTHLTNGTHDIPNDVNYVSVCFKNGTSTDRQIEHGSTATPYVPHAEHEITIPLSEPLRKNDAICVIDGVYGVLRRRNRYAVSSSVGGYNEASDWYYVAIENIDTNLDVSKPMKSNYFTWVNNASYVTNNKNLMSINSSGTHMVFNVESCTSGAEYRAWLDEHDVYVECELATPVFEPFEDQTPFQNIKAFDELTQFQVENVSDNLNGWLSVNYMEIEAKTDWTAETPINSADGNGYNRIINNLTQLKAFADTLFDGLTDFSLGEEKDYLSLIYAREMNAIEDALETINLETANLEIGTKQIFRANGKTPIYTEYNRIESAILNLYKTLMAQKNALPRLAFRLGGQKGFRV